MILSQLNESDLRAITAAAIQSDFPTLKLYLNLCQSYLNKEKLFNYSKSLINSTILYESLTTNQPNLYIDSLQTSSSLISEAKTISEKFGLPDYDNLTFRSKLHDIVNDLLSIKNMNKQQVLSINNYEFTLNYAELTYNDTNLAWINKLTIYISNQFPDEIKELYDNGIFAMFPMIDKSLKLISATDEIQKIENGIYDELILYVIVDQKIADHIELYYTLYHELIHAINYLGEQFINTKDEAYFFNKIANLNFNFNIDNFIEFDKDKIKQIYQNIKPQQIYAIIIHMLYFCNYSEKNALNATTYKDFVKFFQDKSHYDIFNKYSDEKIAIYASDEMNTLKNYLDIIDYIFRYTDLKIIYDCEEIYLLELKTIFKMKNLNREENFKFKSIKNILKYFRRNLNMQFNNGLKMIKEFRNNSAIL